MRLTIFVVFFVFIGMWGCVSFLASSSKKSKSNGNQVTTTVSQEAAEGLDLQALTGLVGKVQSAEELEKKLNEPGSINNLDLNSDGNVDYIKVTEYGDKKEQFGFSLTTEPEKGEEQEVAVIEIAKNNKEAVVQVQGNEQIYGHNHHYHSIHPLTTFLLWSYLISPHPFWYHSYGWGHYPGYYRPYSTVTSTMYRERAGGFRTNSQVNTQQGKRLTTGITSPNKGKTANNGIVKSLRNPTSAQKQFAVRSQSKSVRSGGFGRNSNSKSSGSVRGQSSSRSFGGFGK